MAHNDEPMDIDHMDSDFDNKENSIHHSNVYPRTPSTEKGYEELDVSELNMKLRYSITPAASPMSKSYTANCADNRTFESDDTLNANLTRSLHSAMSRGDKSVKTLPLQSISTEQFVDNNRTTVLRSLDSTVVVDGNVTVTVTQPNDIDENISFPSSSSSTAQTPEATTPTKDIPRSDGGSPIMRGLKSVLNMFRSSQSPIPPADGTETTSKQVLSSVDMSTSTPDHTQVGHAVLASTPIAANKQKEGNLSKRSSPLKESLVFNEDLEKELLWKDETTILFSQEKIPIHKLFLQHTPNSKDIAKAENQQDNLNSTVEYMDISHNDSMIKNKTITDLQSDGLNESDGEFVDCETTFTNKSEMDAIIANESNDNEDSDNYNAISVESHLEALVNPKTSLLNESSMTELGHSNDTKIISDGEDKKYEIQAQFQQLEGVLNITTSLNFKEPAGNNVNTNVDKIFEESNTPEESNITSEVEKTESKPQNDPTNITFESSSLPAEEIVLKPENNITLVLPGSDSNLNFVDTQSKITNSTFVQHNESFSTFADTCTPKNENATYIKETVTTDHSDINNIIYSDIAVNVTVVKDIESSPLSLDDTNTIITPETTYIKEFASLPLDDNNATVSKSKNATFIKEFESLPLPLEDTVTIVAADTEEITFVKEIESVQEINDAEIPSNIDNVLSIDQTYITLLPCDHKNVQKSAFVEDTTKEVNSVPVDNTTLFPTVSVGYNSFVNEIENDFALEEKSNTSTPSTEVDFRDFPANIPLPDEDDIENEKSLGTTMFVEEKIIPVDVHLDDSSVTKLENDDAEKIPIIMAKSIDGTTIFSNAHKELSTFEVEDKMEDIDFPNMQKITTNEMSDITGERQFQQSTFMHKGIEDNFHISMAVIGANVGNDNQQKIKEQENASKMYPQSLRTNIPENLELEISNLDVNKVASDVIDEPIPVPKVTQEVANTNTTIAESEDEINRIKVTGLEPEEGTNNIAISTKILEMPIPAAEQNKLDVTNVIKDSTQIISDITMEVNKSVFETTQKYEAVVINSGTLENNDEITDIVGEIIMSEKNSPYVAVAGEINSPHAPLTDIDEISNPFAMKSRIVSTPPSSPKIVSKGYNFNFDEIDDPFATKTKIRLSPTPDTSPKDYSVTFEEKVEPPQRDTNKNRRKSQPERKRPVMPKKKLNATFSGSVKTKAEDISKLNNKTAIKTNQLPLEEENRVLESDATFTRNGEESRSDNKIDDLNSSETNMTKNDESVPEKYINTNVPKEQKSLDDRDIDTSTEDKEENKFSIENCSSNEIKTTSSSDQSTYYSLGTSSGESVISKNVFNIPEIDDTNFNPFVTKSKMRLSPPPGSFEHAQYDCFTKPDTAITEINKPDCEDMASTSVTVEENANISNITCSSKATDEKDITVREVHTEDEDTQEGPFFEADAMSDFDGEDVDMMQFSELPPQKNVENIETGEMFIDAEAFEFLLNQNKSNIVSDSGKESLFLKFDPLFAKRVSSDGVLAALNNIQKRQSTPKKIAPAVLMDTTFEKAEPGPSKLNVTHEVDTNISAEEITEDRNITVSKPMMVVTPAVNPVVTPRNKITTPTSSNRRSITFTSPAIAVIDRLLSLSANNSLVGHDTTVTHVGREQNEADLALIQLRELLADKEISVYNLRSESKELKDRLSSLEAQVKTLESESQERLKKVNELNEKLTEKTKLNKSMAAVVEEYERTIASLIAETEQDKKRNNEERIKLIKERDEQTAHLTSMEVSFSDLHSKYEKSKQIILTCKANEDFYKKSIKEFEENLSKMQANYELLKQHATTKLNHANQELEKMNRAHESKVLKMNAMLKRNELHITSLEETLAQKTKANEELSAICEELINKVG